MFFLWKNDKVFQKFSKPVSVKNQWTNFEA